MSRWTPEQKEACRYKTMMALRHGEIKGRRRCRVCGSPEYQVHHEDYDNHLDVRFYCYRHHTDRHVEIRREDKQARLAEAARAAAGPGHAVGASA